MGSDGSPGGPDWCWKPSGVGVRGGGVMSGLVCPRGGGWAAGVPRAPGGASDWVIWGEVWGEFLLLPSVCRHSVRPLVTSDSKKNGEEEREAAKAAEPSGAAAGPRRGVPSLSLLGAEGITKKPSAWEPARVHFAPSPKRGRLPGERGKTGGGTERTETRKPGTETN